MAHQTQPKVTPASANLKYEAYITEKAKEFAPMLHEAFPTESALLIALDNSVRFLQTANETMADKVTAEYYLLHSPLSNYPDQALALMVLFVASGVFQPSEQGMGPFSVKESAKWTFVPQK